MIKIRENLNLESIPSIEVEKYGVVTVSFLPALEETYIKKCRFVYQGLGMVEFFAVPKTGEILEICVPGLNKTRNCYDKSLLDDLECKNGCPLLQTSDCIVESDDIYYSSIYDIDVDFSYVDNILELIFCDIKKGSYKLSSGNLEIIIFESNIFGLSFLNIRGDEGNTANYYVNK